MLAWQKWTMAEKSGANNENLWSFRNVGNKEFMCPETHPGNPNGVRLQSRIFYGVYIFLTVWHFHVSAAGANKCRPLDSQAGWFWSLEDLNCRWWQIYKTGGGEGDYSSQSWCSRRWTLEDRRRPHSKGSLASTVSLNKAKGFFSLRFFAAQQTNAISFPLLFNFLLYVLLSYLYLDVICNYLYLIFYCIFSWSHLIMKNMSPFINNLKLTFTVLYLIFFDK